MPCRCLRRHRRHLQNLSHGRIRLDRGQSVVLQPAGSERSDDVVELRLPRPSDLGLQVSELGRECRGGDIQKFRTVEFSKPNSPIDILQRYGQSINL